MNNQPSPDGAPSGPRQPRRQGGFLYDVRQEGIATGITFRF